MDHSWRTFFNQIVNQLQTFLSDERYKNPEQDGANVSKLENNEFHKGGTLYNSSTNTYQVNIKNQYTGSVNPEYRFKTIITYEEMDSSKFSNIVSGERNGRIIFVTDTGVTHLGVNNMFITL
ncbi:hypothetical protein [Flavobacterium sp.]|uniref:hypothetical protein n=1 Tax=Flavobacterium sp. TaxID=239 RepID=UPI003F69DE8F